MMFHARFHESNPAIWLELPRKFIANQIKSASVGQIHYFQTHKSHGYCWLYVPVSSYEEYLPILWLAKQSCFMSFTGTIICLRPYLKHDSKHYSKHYLNTIHQPVLLNNTIKALFNSTLHKIYIDILFENTMNRY
jgi:hypothetical protein